MSEIELKRCPFCGSKVRIHHVEGRGYFIACEGAECLVNPLTFYRKTEIKAAEAWNRRAES